MQRAKEEQEVLVRDKNYVKYERLLARAEENGRLDGKRVGLTGGWPRKILPTRNRREIRYGTRPARLKVFSFYFRWIETN